MSYEKASMAPVSDLCSIFITFLGVAGWASKPFLEFLNQIEKGIFFKNKIGP